MNEKRIFYSWQSDLDHKFNWKLIEKCLNTSIIALNEKSKHIKLSLDLATRGLPGSPDIVDSIFRKIENSNIFIADITPITKIGLKGIPNPNVLIELGFAVNVIGWENIICIHNKSYGTIEELPFDIKQRRITTYKVNAPKEQEKQLTTLTEILNIAIPEILKKQSDLDEITEIFKLQIDHTLLSIVNHFNSIFNIKESKLGIDVFFDVIDQLSNNLIILKEIKIKKTEDFLKNKINELKKISQHPLLILTKNKKQIISIMKLIDSLNLLRENILSNRFYDRNQKKGKSKLKESGIITILLSDIAKAIENILENWGNHLLTNPAFL